jgi:hypothetical protein
MKNLPEQHQDASGRLKASPSDDHVHPVNKKVHPGLAKRSDFDPQGVETPARVSRARVNPAAANAQRRAGLIDVNEIRSPSGSNSHVPESTPGKL